MYLGTGSDYRVKCCDSVWGGCSDFSRVPYRIYRNWYRNLYTYVIIKILYYGGERGVGKGTIRPIHHFIFYDDLCASNNTASVVYLIII